MMTECSFLAEGTPLISVVQIHPSSNILSLWKVIYCLIVLDIWTSYYKTWPPLHTLFINSTLHVTYIHFYKIIALHSETSQNVLSLALLSFFLSFSFCSLTWEMFTYSSLQSSSISLFCCMCIKNLLLILRDPLCVTTPLTNSLKPSRALPPL